MRDQKGQKRVFQICEVKRLAAHLHLIGGQVDGHVVHRQIVGRRRSRCPATEAGGCARRTRRRRRRAPRSRPSPARAGGTRPAASSSTMTSMRCRAVLHQQLLCLRHVRQRVAARLVDRPGRSAGCWASSFLNCKDDPAATSTSKPESTLLELVRVVKAVGHEYDGFPLHHAPPFHRAWLQHPQIAVALPLRSRSPGTRSSRRAWRSPGSRGCGRRASRA